MTPISIAVLRARLLAVAQEQGWTYVGLAQACTERLGADTPVNHSTIYRALRQYYATTSTHIIHALADVLGVPLGENSDEEEAMATAMKAVGGGANVIALLQRVGDSHIPVTELLALLERLGSMDAATRRATLGLICPDMHTNMHTKSPDSAHSEQTNHDGDDDVTPDTATG